MCSALSKSRERFFSVSPMYFETTRERSTRNTGRPVYLAEHRRRERLAGPGRAVEQRAVARLHPLAHAPVVEHRVVEPDPVLDLADLTHGVRMQDDVVPVHLGLDVLGGEVGAETRQAHRAGREPLDDLGVEDQPSAHHRFALAHRVEPEHVPAGEPVLARQQPLHLHTPGQVVSGKHELRRLAGREHPAVMFTTQATELGQVSPVRHVFGDQTRKKSGWTCGTNTNVRRTRSGVVRASWPAKALATCPRRDTDRCEARRVERIARGNGWLSLS